MLRKKSFNKSGQITIFIILAIVIIMGIALYFIFRGDVLEQEIPLEVKPVYEYYLSCIEAECLDGASILGQQGGYIENPEFSSGSSYMPFSSQLDFLGVGVPYWYYISGNGISSEQIPSREKMEVQLSNYIDSELSFCDFSVFEEQGFEIIMGESEVETFIKDNIIEVNINQDIAIAFGDTIWLGNTHNVKVKSSLGKFYNLAKKIYENQKETMFLENYGLDILRLYAPVDGSEIGCSPLIWNIEDIRNDLIEALEANIPMTKIKGDYYELGVKENQYFIHDIGEETDINVNFMYSRDWPMKLEVWPSEEGFLEAKPIGLQEGLGMLGFCYVPYHFVYDFAYPVLIQVYSGSEIFQFPVVVLIEKNNPREALDVEGLPDVVPELCEYKNSEMTIYTYNTDLEPVEANIKYKCFDTTCDIGKTELQGDDAVLTNMFPQCINGNIIASAEGYETEKHLISSLNENLAFIVLNKKYNLSVEVQKDGEFAEGDSAIIIFSKEGKVQTLAYPQQKNIELTAGQYQIKAYIYSNSTIRLEGSSTEKCSEVPRAGVAGFFGLTEEKCFTLEIPDQIVSSAVSGGGTENYYIGQSELLGSDKIVIDADNFGLPRKVEDLQENYNKIETSGLEVEFI